jgi:hypothetical protein
VSGPHCNCAYDECTVTSCKTCGAEIPGRDKRATQHDLCLSCKGARIPARCPYQAGTRVVLEASPGMRDRHPDDPERTGFRGVVEGTIGAHLLIGLRDDGREWCEQWGGLQPEAKVRKTRPVRLTRVKSTG